MSVVHLWLSLAWLAVCYLPLASARLTLLVGETTYSAKAARFGYPLSDGYLRSGILMLPPPPHKGLCEFPESLVNVTVEYPNSIALLVNLGGGCNVEQKAKVAMALHQTYSSQIRYVVMYNNDVRNMDGLVSLNLSGAYSNEFDALSFVSVSTATGAAVQATIRVRTAAIWNTAFLTSSVTDWDLWFNLRWSQDRPRPPPPRLPTPQRSNNTDDGDGFFFMMRFVLFGLFIIAPCLRAAYLWRAGGGAIVFRRNEAGRITGLQYVRPEPYWFISNRRRRDEEGHHEGEGARSGLLTEDQVKALPEIEFQEPIDDEETAVGESESSPSPPSERALNEDLELSIQEYRTSCTTCSICIEDFEPGEKIRVLPRCRHAYHTECLMPWLTERHGSCPLCKEHVLEREEEDSEPEEGTQPTEHEQPAYAEHAIDHRSERAQDPPPV